MKLAFLLGSPYELAIIAAVVVLMFGGPKIAGLGKSLAQSVREFKETTRSKEVLPGEEKLALKSSTILPASTAETEKASTEDAFVKANKNNAH